MILKKLNIYKQSCYILLVIFVISLFGFSGSFAKVFEQIGTPSAPTPTQVPAPHATYSSNKLGISFNYIPVFPNGVGQYFFIREIGDIIYLYWVPGADKPFSGSDSEFLQTIAPGSKYVEVFNKEPQQSLQDAIRQRFLAGYSEADCSIGSTGNHPRKDESFQTAIIDFPHHSNQTREQLVSLISKCPKYVKSFNGVSYF